jgi:hypothetical protein
MLLTWRRTYAVLADSHTTPGWTGAGGGFTVRCSRPGGPLSMSFRRGSFELVYLTGMFNARLTLPLMLLLAAAGTPSASLAQCVSGQQARELIAQGQVVTFPEALQRAGVSRDQVAGNPQLCQAGGGFVYKVRVYQDGQLSGVNIPAN